MPTQMRFLFHIFFHCNNKIRQNMNRNSQKHQATTHHNTTLCAKTCCTYTTLPRQIFQWDSIVLYAGWLHSKIKILAIVPWALYCNWIFWNKHLTLFSSYKIIGNKEWNTTSYLIKNLLIFTTTTTFSDHGWTTMESHSSCLLELFTQPKCPPDINSVTCSLFTPGLVPCGITILIAPHLHWIKV
jgi:hypothetical protein